MLADPDIIPNCYERTATMTAPDSPRVAASSALGVGLLGAGVLNGGNSVGVGGRMVGQDRGGDKVGRLLGLGSARGVRVC